MGRTSGCLIHNWSALSNARPISEKSAYVGRLLRSRPEWSWLQSGDGKDKWLFDSQPESSVKRAPISEKSAYVGRLLRSRPEWSWLQSGDGKDKWLFDSQQESSIKRAADFGEIGVRRSTSPKSTGVVMAAEW